MSTRVVDVEQLIRIENVHGGFLYQHLYSTSAILLASTLKWKSLIIEHDEDLEIVYEDRHLYVQIKKRAEVLTYSDIQTAIERFGQIRDLHKNNQRKGNPHLWIVCNSPLGPDLAGRVKKDDWPIDVFLRTPGFCSGELHLLPSPEASIAEALSGCEDMAAQIPHSTLSSGTLVYKLAAWIQLKASGATKNHHVLAQEVGPLFEQLVVQIQQFPATTDNYRPHDNEPQLVNSAVVRLITGFSGSGKTSWAAEVDIHQAGTPIYFDVSDLPSSSLAGSLVRDLAARLLPANSEERQALLLPGVMGFQGLRLINEFIGANALKTIIFFDNCHRVSGPDLVALVSSMSNVHWILLAQPWPGIALIEGRFGISQEMLSGWSIATISKEIEFAKCYGSASTCDQLRGITGGLPLFVRDTCKIAKLEYGGNVEACNLAISGLVNLQTTSQEVIAIEVFRRLSDSARKCAAILSIATMFLQREDVFSMIAAAFVKDQGWVAQYLRELSDWGVVQHYRNGWIRLHDMFLLLAKGERERQEQEILKRGREALLVQLVKRKTGGGVELFRQMSRLLLDIGQIEALIDSVTGDAELINEHGIARETSELVRLASLDPTLSQENRFWAQDTLAFWSIQSGDYDKAEAHIAEMAILLEGIIAAPPAILAFEGKKLMIAGLRGNLDVLRKTFQAFDLKGAGDSISRLIRYNYAVGLFKCDRPNEAIEHTDILTEEYYRHLGLKKEDVTFKNPDEIAVHLGDVSSKADDLKHLADCLDLGAMARFKLGRPSGFARIHAHKFYVMSNSLSSAVRVGQDFVDECLALGSDPYLARDFIVQSLIPIVRDFKLLEHLVPVNCQYAVVLAYGGNIKAAHQTLEEMRSYIIPGTEQAEEFSTQSKLVNSIARGEVALPRIQARNPEARRKIGRNEPCHCGSGKKFKKCHGS